MTEHLKMACVSMTLDLDEQKLSFVVDDDHVCDWDCHDQEEVEEIQEKFTEILQAGMKAAGLEIAAGGFKELTVIGGEYEY